MSDGPRIAVLPLSNISSDNRDEYFADGMTEELISTLSRIAGLRVIARTSVIRYKATTKPIIEIGKELGVNTILEGSVRKSGNKIRITAQLIDASSEEHLWAQEYDRELEDIFTIQSDIAKRIAKALKVRVMQSESLRLEKKATGIPEAYSFYLKGRHSSSTRAEAGLNSAIGYFEKALKADPKFALAYTGLADAYSILALLEFVPPREAFPKAKIAAEKALALDDRLAEAHVSLGLVRFQYEWDWSGAEKEFKRALELNSGYAPAHQYYADYLKALGRFDDALSEMGQAKSLDPLSLAINTGVGHVLYLSREYDRSIEQYRKTVDSDPAFIPARLWFGRPYMQKGMFREAIDQLKEAVKLSNESTVSLAMLGQAYASAGQANEAQEILGRLLERAKKQYVPSYWIALVQMSIGNKDEAFAWLERAYNERSSWLVWANVEPRFDRLRDDARFDSILSRMRLGALQPIAQDDVKVRSLLSSLSNVALSHYKVIGNYTRHDEKARNLLKDLKQKIISGLESSAPKHENYLVWAPPGSGKTFFVHQISDALRQNVRYSEINLAETDERAFRGVMTQQDMLDGPSLFFVDEADSRKVEAWPYEALIPYLDAKVHPNRRQVFILAGSSGTSMKEMKRNITSHPKGLDLLSRIPQGNEYEIPAMTPGDRILITLASLKQAGRDIGKNVMEVEKLALYYAAVTPELANARQLRESALRCVERMPAGEDRVRYDNLFGSGDIHGKEFWIKARTDIPDLIGAYVRLDD
ncbi:tetratricopeptide repeat protein [Candidatus Bathyarchaeota archaeon]|nr:MAG: tetratricopeptide repeat protein [Candidatus Bathyarchaeota archaeon]